MKLLLAFILFVVPIVWNIHRNIKKRDAECRRLTRAMRQLSSTPPSGGVSYGVRRR